MAPILFRIEEDIATLRLHNTVANVLDMDAISALTASIHQASESCRAAVICGGDKFFSNGLDLQWAMTLDRPTLRGVFLALNDLVLLMLQTPIPLVGAMRGHAIGAGKTLFCACDHRVAASGRALIGMPEVTLGVPNPFFADQLVRFLTPDAVASELIYSGALITAERAATIGLVDEICEAERVEERAFEKAVALTRIPSLAFASSKHQRTVALRETIRTHIAGMTENLLDAWFSEQAQRLMRAAVERLQK